jgi:hypothetical protein
MKQQNKFWLALVLITIVCFVDYQMFTEGYAVRRLSPMVRQAGHFVVLLTVIPIGWWAWKQHTMQWLKQLWLYSYGIALAFIVLIGLLKSQTNILTEDFLDWVTTVRYFFTSPLPHLLLYMLSLIAQQRSSNAQ